MLVVITILMLFIAWAINTHFTLDRVYKELNIQREKDWYWFDREAIDKVLSHYSPFWYKSWFGFRSWFVPFRPEDYK
jgi:hypothetical protein